MERARKHAAVSFLMVTFPHCDPYHTIIYNFHTHKLLSDDSYCVVDLRPSYISCIQPPTLHHAPPDCAAAGMKVLVCLLRAHTVRNRPPSSHTETSWSRTPCFSLGSVPWWTKPCPHQHRRLRMTPPPLLAHKAAAAKASTARLSTNQRRRRHIEISPNIWTRRYSTARARRRPKLRALCLGRS